MKDLLTIVNEAQKLLAYDNVNANSSQNDVANIEC